MIKVRHAVFIIALVVLADQALKIYIKTHFGLNDHQNVLGEKFQLYFVENPGMAYGMKFGGSWGKLALTIFRMAAVFFGTWYLGSIIRQKYHAGFIICASLIYAGALGNLIDSAFYGLIFDRGMLPVPNSDEYIGYAGVAAFAKHGYASFMHGNVVDMLYFKLISGTFPKWVPFWGGQDFEFFRPIFNLADAAISTGVITILVFQKRFFKQRKGGEDNHTVETGALVNDESQVS
ncbi:MAG: lipoprotein signal peptidase [Bacteroidetes bacterium]|nr:lipoprotein signal peptidase [Bacteroidota bacterium]